MLIQVKLGDIGLDAHFFSLFSFLVIFLLFVVCAFFSVLCSSWAEHDPQEIMSSIHHCIREVLEGVSPPIRAEQIVSIGITNQRETTVIWDKITGLPLHNALVWHDTRTVDIVAEMCALYTDGKEHFRQHCGLPISTYFSALKLNWLLTHVPSVNEAIQNGRALAGTIDSWIIYNLTGGIQYASSAHVTDITNASRTMLMNLHTKQWDAHICKEFAIPMAILPTIRSNSEIYGHVFEGPLKGVPIAGVSDTHTTS